MFSKVLNEVHQILLEISLHPQVKLNAAFMDFDARLDFRCKNANIFQEDFLSLGDKALVPYLHFCYENTKHLKLRHLVCSDIQVGLYKKIHIHLFKFRAVQRLYALISF